MVNSIKRREFLKGSAMLVGAAGACGLTSVEIVAMPGGVPVPYEVNGKQFEGMIVYDDSVKTKRAAIFMQPDWNGVSTETIALARTVAGKEYIVLLADMFGVRYGDRTKTRQ